MLSYEADSKNFIQDFINEHVIGQGLDNRTEKAYRLDLEHFCAWMEQELDQSDREDYGIDLNGNAEPDKKHLEDWMEIYLNYLSAEKRLSRATVCRKSRVLEYYLSYLSGQGVINRNHSLKLTRELGRKPQQRELLSKKESDAFFTAINQEYEGLDNEFRKRICLRNLVMMELLFYHKIEISELLRLQVSDYEQGTGILTIRRKRGRDSQVYLFSQELRQKMGQWLEERKEFRCEGEYYEWIFLSKLGKPLSMKMVIKIVDKYREIAGIKKQFTPKDLKESCMKQYAKELVMERYG